MQTPPYRLLVIRGYPCLLCLLCNQRSHNPHDIAFHYCDRCGFLDELPDEVRGPEVTDRGWQLQVMRPATGTTHARL